jgi:hypothetical protein
MRQKLGELDYGVDETIDMSNVEERPMKEL